MWVTVVCLGLFAPLFVVLLPSARVRQAVLAFAARAGWSGAVAAVAACGTFFARPDTAPDAAAPLLAAVRDALPVWSAAHPGLPWLLLAGAVVSVCLPVLSLVEFAARVTGQTAVIQSLRRELRAAADRLDQRLAGMAPPAAPAETAAELAAAADALRAVAGDHPRPRPTAPRLVRDLL